MGKCGENALTKEVGEEGGGIIDGVSFTGREIEKIECKLGIVVQFNTRQ